MKLELCQTSHYQLRHGLGYWLLKFAGRNTVFKHEHGAYYVAYLLLNPPEEPIHGLALALKARGKYEFSRRSVEVADPVNGRNALVERDAVFQQRNLGLDDALAARALWRIQHRLEAVLEDDQVIEPVKREAMTELVAVYRAQRSSNWQARDAAARCMCALRRAVVRFLQRLHRAGEKDPVLAAFAAHLDKYLIISSRGAESVAVPAGCFYYQAPGGIIWRENTGQ